MKRRLLTLLLALMLLCSISITAYAHDVPDVNRTDCSIEVVVRYDGEAVSGGKLTCIRVGYVYEEDGNYSFRRVFDDKALDDIQSATLAEELAKFVEDNAKNYEFEKITLTVGEDGKASFEGLSVGLYLIVQDTPASGYSALKPFLVSVPYLEDGVYQYQVSAAIKSELEREPEPTEPKPTEPEKPADPTLPQTGQLNWPVPVLAVGGLLLFAFGYALRKKTGYEK